MRQLRRRLSGAICAAVPAAQAQVASPAGVALTRIAGGGRTLMPGLIDAHTHLMFETLPQVAVLTSDVGFVNVAAVKGANDMLMRGFTSVRDLGGPVYGLKRGIDAGLVPGPRIWPSGAFISQSGGHGDFRLLTELPAPPDAFSYSERIGAAAIADDTDSVRKRAREQPALGASQIKLMAEKGVWWSLQPFLDDRPSAFAEGSPNRIKQLEMFGGTDAAYTLAREYKVKTAWGTDNLFSAENAAKQGATLAKMVRWYTPAEALEMATRSPTSSGSTIRRRTSW
jgi:imidazolonepropionase-like amidohydrolase